jgi:hypothetical protein
VLRLSQGLTSRDIVRALRELLCDRLTLYPIAVYKYLLIAVFNRITRQAYNAFNKISVVHVWWEKYHNITSLGIIECQHFGPYHWESNSVGILIDKNIVAYFQCGYHRRRRYLERLHQKRAQHEYNQQDRKK